MSAKRSANKPRVLSFSEKVIRGMAHRVEKERSAVWAKTGAATALSLFHAAAKQVPAYKSFLSQHALNTDMVHTPTDFRTVPAVDKKNYIRKYAYNELFWNGSLASPQVLTSTSGSTGAPVFFSRNAEIDERSAKLHEMFFQSSSLKKDAPTLVVICFGMGVWIGGVITYQAFELLGRQGYPFSIITPGLNKKEIIKILHDLLPEYDQLILAGYPPFLKDVIDEALTAGVRFSKKRIALLFAAEGFTEAFRDHIAHKVGIRSSTTDTANIYGSADIGTMAIETPISIAIRRFATSHADAFSSLFDREMMKTPTFAQFNPEFVYFEENDGSLLLTADNCMPLIRYDIGDMGGVYSYEEVEHTLQKNGTPLDKILSDENIPIPKERLPFVYVYERKDFVVTFYGLQIYPELIREVLLRDTFERCLTGKFTLATKFDDRQNQYLEINLEMKPGYQENDTLAHELTQAITRILEERSSEYRELVASVGERARPRLLFWAYEYQDYFRPGIKQRWVSHTP